MNNEIGYLGRGPRFGDTSGVVPQFEAGANTTWRGVLGRATATVHIGGGITLNRKHVKLRRPEKEIK